MNLKAGKRFQTNFYTFKTKEKCYKAAGVETLTAGTPTTYLSEWKQAYYFSCGVVYIVTFRRLATCNTPTLTYIYDFRVQFSGIVSVQPNV